MSTTASTTPQQHKQLRELCWELRDRLYSCLEQNNEDLKECTIPYNRLKDACPASWTKRFIGKRKYEMEKRSATYFEARGEDDIAKELKELRDMKNDERK